MKQHLSILKFYGHNDQTIYDQVYLVMIVYCLNVLAQLNTESHQSSLQINWLLKAFLWKLIYTWVQKVQKERDP